MQNEKKTTTRNDILLHDGCCKMKKEHGYIEFLLVEKPAGALRLTSHMKT